MLEITNRMLHDLPETFTVLCIICNENYFQSFRPFLLLFFFFFFFFLDYDSLIENVESGIWGEYLDQSIRKCLS